AGQTAISTVGKEGLGLSYRGYSINDLAENASFEEVAYLLIHEKLPTGGGLDPDRKYLYTLRGLPGELRQVLEQNTATAHPTDVLRTGCSALGTLEPETTEHGSHQVADRLLAIFPAMLLYWYHFSHDGRRIETESDEKCLAGHFLRLLHGKMPDELTRRAV